MSKRLMLFAALVAALCCAGQASATSVLAKADTLYMNMADSSAVLDVSTASRMWVDFIVPPGPPCATCVDAGVDTLIRLLVQVREHLSAAAGTDSILEYPVTGNSDSLLLCRRYVQGVAGNADSTARAEALNAMAGQRAAAYSDTTVIPWVPRFQLAAVGDDSVKVGARVPSIYNPSSSEFIVDIPPLTVKYGNKQRAARLDLINVNGCAPFRAQFASIRWRLVQGNGVVANNPAAVKLRVVLGKETW
jgi:hypothetical protein